MHDQLQAFEIPVVAVGLDEAGIGPLIHIAQGRYLKPRVVVGPQGEPARVDGGGLTELVTTDEEIADPKIDERRAGRVCHIALRIGLTLRIIRKQSVGRGANVARCEISEKRILARSAVAVTIVACALPRKRS